MGSWVKLFTTVPRRVSLSGSTVLVVCAHNGLMAPEQQRNTAPSASAPTDCRPNMHFESKKPAWYFIEATLASWVRRGQVRLALHRMPGRIDRLSQDYLAVK